MNNSHYSPSEDNVALNANYQGINPNLDIDNQKATTYPVIDNLQNATVNDNFIFLSTTDRQHKCYESGAFATKEDYTNMSGYFTNEATALNRVNPDGTFDAYGFHRDVCVQPTIYATESHELMDKRHLDCFYVDRDRMEQIYGTRDFNAAIGKCNANNQYGSDGGDQGYNAALTELYNNGCLKYAGTYDADPASTIKCRNEYEGMSIAAEKKCDAIISGKTPEEVQKIGYPLDERCHQKTAFNSEPIDNFQEKYKNHQTTYNQKLADSTTNEDRLINRSMNNTPEQKSLTEGSAVTNKLPEKQAEGGPITLSEIPQTPSPKQNQESKSVGARHEDLDNVQSPKTVNQPSVGPQNPSQTTPVEDSTLFKNLSGNKESGINPENEAVSAATKATGGIHNG